MALCDEHIMCFEQKYNLYSINLNFEIISKLLILKLLINTFWKHWILLTIPLWISTTVDSNIQNVEN